MRVNLTLIALLPFLLVACGGDEPRRVPDLRGQRLDVAERRLDALGLEYERVGGGTFGIVVSSNWRVCDQQPAPGREATDVTLIVDRICPPPLHEVPDLVGETLSDAERDLERQSIPYEVRSAFGDDPVDALWQVCRQRPAAGKRARQVVLYAASSCETPVAPIVPSVLGDDLEDAEARLALRGIELEVLPRRPAPELLPFWEVCEQDPLPGERARTVRVFAERECGY